MAIRRHLIDWTRPALVVAAESLLRDAGEGPLADLHETTIAVPTGWAARRLLEILVDCAEQRGLALVPPQIVTIGELPELLYDPKFPFADSLTQQLAWIQALREAPQEDVQRIVRQLPAEGDHFSWLALGEMLAGLHREMAGDAVNFSHVVELTRELAGANEVRRWQVLRKIQERYLAILDDLQLWDRQTARLVAIEYQEFQAHRPVVLIGMVDLNKAQRQMLDQVADHVAALVVAPESLADRFDEHGCVVPERWQDVCIDRVFDRCEIVESPGDQADAAARAIAEFDGRYAAEQIVVGVPDERIVPYVRQRLEECELPVRYGAGLKVAHSGPGRLLRAVAEYLAAGRFPALAALLRHPDVEHWLRERDISGEYLTELDDYYRDHLPTRLTLDRLDGEKHPHLHRAFVAVDKLLRDIAGRVRLLPQWTAPVIELLVELFGRRPLNREDDHDRAILVACDKIRAALETFEQLRDSLAPRVSGADALRLVLREIEGELIPPPAGETAIEMLGWLDLPLDDAPALVITGFNEGIVPASRNGDVFLPNELRRKLGLEDNDRRLARDAYFLSLLAASRKELRLIAGRRTADHDPLIPSRLLFACDSEEIPRRVLALFEKPPQPRRPPLPGSLRPGRTQHAFEVPRPGRLPVPVTSMRVTEFADYLACPYRYYLRRRLNLEGRDSQLEELPANSFGSLLHEVLQRFGESDARLLTDPDRIAEALDEELDRLTRGFYGSEPLPAVLVQVEQIRYRLRAFARWQARWAADGWRIEWIERTFRETDGAHLPVDGEPMPLRGRIDRIDVRDTSRGVERVVFDYKTGDAGADPVRKHRKFDGTWIDLQLPLYRHLLRVDGITDDVRLGYIVLPKDVRRTGPALADWTEHDLADADRVACEVVCGVRSQTFWPMNPEARYFEEFAAICQDEVYGAVAAEDGNDE